MSERLATAVMAAFVMCLVAAPAPAADFFVDATAGNDVLDGLTWVSAKRSINPALVAAEGTPEADTVMVAAGVYYERIEIPPNVTLIGSVPAGGGLQDILVHPSIIDAQRRSRAILFGPGTDDSAIDGFVIRRGNDPDGDGGGGMFIDGTHPRVSRCIFEWNTSTTGGQALFTYIPDGAADVPLIESCLFRNNGPMQILISGMGLDAGPFPAPIMRDCIVENAMGTSWPESRFMGGGVYVGTEAPLRFENVIVRDNNFSAAFSFANGCVSTLVNCEISGRASGLYMTGGLPGRFEIVNCTIRASAGPALDGRGGVNLATELDMRRCIVVGSGREFNLDGRPGAIIVGHDDGGNRGYFAADLVQDNLILGWPSSLCCNTDAAATFASGPLGDSCLSQAAAGQAIDSLGVDASSALASDVGMDLLTTRTDAVTDSGACDYGVHYRPGGIFGEVGLLTVNRGIVADGLSFVTQVTTLPWTDAPGTLSDSSLSLLFYSIEMPENEIHVEKDLPGDTVRIRF